jgi:hypothetical protein
MGMMVEEIHRKKKREDLVGVEDCSSVSVVEESENLRVLLLILLLDLMLISRRRVVM